MDNLQAAREPQKEIQQGKFVITEINNFQQLFSLLRDSHADGKTLSSFRVSENLKKLVDRAESIEKKLFIVETDGGRWSVIASSADELRLVQVEIKQISALQEKIDPEKLVGQCIYVHEFASAIGISDGNMFAGDIKGYNSEKSIYSTKGGIHEIGFKKLSGRDRTIYFDLTAKPYIFTESDPNNAVMEGVIVVDGENQTSMIRELYQCDWYANAAEANKPTPNHILEQLKKKFLKNNAKILAQLIRHRFNI